MYDPDIEPEALACSLTREIKTCLSLWPVGSTVVITEVDGSVGLRSLGHPSGWYLVVTNPEDDRTAYVSPLDLDPLTLGAEDAYGAHVAWLKRSDAATRAAETRRLHREAA